MPELVPWEDLTWIPFPTRRDAWEEVTDTSQWQAGDAFRRYSPLEDFDSYIGRIAGVDGETIYIWQYPGLFEDPDLVSANIEDFTHWGTAIMYRYPNN